MKFRTLFLALASSWALADGGAAERAAFPADYAQRLQQQGEPMHSERSGVTTVYANELAAKAAKAGTLPFPDGAVIVMEFASPLKDEQGRLRRDARGVLLKGGILHVDVMARGPAAVESAASRAGRWSFASYGPDGKVLVTPEGAASCADCHRNVGADKDFVFRKRPWSVAE
jgi:hypothetical protein